MLMRVGAIVIAGSLAATAAHAQLMSERVEGAMRFCRYAPTGLSTPRQVSTGTVAEIDADLELRRREEAYRRGSSRASGEREMAIDASRTCPGTYPDRQESGMTVPLYATLSSQRRVNGDLICHYQYLGRVYAISLGQRSICPYTPIGISY